MDSQFVLFRKDILMTKTFGELTLLGEHICNTLEDKVRESEPFKLGETAIPYGRYRLIVNYSNRFKKQMIQVINIRGGNTTFHNINIDACGIRLHGGNTESDSLGCILCGKDRDGDTKIYNCKEINDWLILKVSELDKQGEVYLNIVK